jgi:hypothetical protein
MSIDERPRGSALPARKRLYNSLPRTSLEGALGTSVNTHTRNHGTAHEGADLETRGGF